MSTEKKEVESLSFQPLLCRERAAGQDGGGHALSAVALALWPHVLWMRGYVTAERAHSAAHAHRNVPVWPQAEWTRVSGPWEALARASRRRCGRVRWVGQDGMPCVCCCGCRAGPQRIGMSEFSSSFPARALPTLGSAEQWDTARHFPNPVSYRSQFNKIQCTFFLKLCTEDFTVWDVLF